MINLARKNPFLFHINEKYSLFKMKHFSNISTRKDSAFINHCPSDINDFQFSD